VLAARRRTDPFAGLTAAGLAVLAAVTSLSLFYSPQFALWLLPFVAWSGSRAARAVTHGLLAVTAVYFPYLFNLRIVTGYAPPVVRLFTVLSALLAVCRLALGVIGAAALCAGRTGPPPDAPAR
jgi:hypothetical protein